MSHDLANAMRTALMQEMRAQDVSPGDIAERMGMTSLTAVLLDDHDMLVSTAQNIAEALGCHWEARLVTGAQPLAEGVALVRDKP